MKKLPDKSIHLIFSSPPRPNVPDKKTDNKDNNYYMSEYLDKFILYIREMERLLKHEEGCVLILNLKERYQNGFATLFPEKLLLKIVEDTKFKLIDKIPWIKTNPLPTHKTRVGTLGWEHIYVFGTQKKEINIRKDYMKTPYKTSDLSISLCRDYDRLRKNSKISINDAEFFRDIGSQPKNYIVTNKEGENRNDYDYLEEHYVFSSIQGKKTDGKNSKIPLQLAEYFVGGFSQENQIVLDPFGGTGVISAASWRLGRNFVHIDLSPENCEYLKFRIKNIQSRENIFNFYGLQKDDKPKWEEVRIQNNMESGDLF